jgi:hypothetical protein
MAEVGPLSEQDQATRKPAWWRSPAFISLAVSLLVSGGIAPSATGLWNQHNAKLLAQNEAVRKDVSQFILEEQAFGPFATNFVLGVSRDNRVDPDAYSRLVDNLLRQQTSLDVLMINAPPEVKEKIKRYMVALSSLNGAIQQVRDVETMREFWERTSDLLVVQQDLVPALRDYPA